MSPPQLKIPGIERCIYCENHDNLTDEHIIPYSIGGRIILQKSSCLDCCKITQKFEQFIARNFLGIPRAVAGIQRRKKRERPKFGKVCLKDKNGIKKRVNVPIRDVPIINVIPSYINLNTFPNGDVFSNMELAVDKNVQGNDKKFYDLRKKFPGYEVSIESGTFDIVRFENMIWKIALGFFVASGVPLSRCRNIAARIKKQQDKKNISVRRLNLPDPKETNLSICRDIYSIFRDSNEERYGSAIVSTKHIAKRKFISCDISFLGILGYPRYVCLLPVESGFEIATKEFSVT